MRIFPASPKSQLTSSNIGDDIVAVIGINPVPVTKSAGDGGLEIITGGKLGVTVVLVAQHKGTAIKGEPRVITSTEGLEMYQKEFKKLLPKLRKQIDEKSQTPAQPERLDQSTNS